jgi:hypothetical protein
MTTHVDKTYAALIGHPAPRDLEWTSFVALWEERADSTEQETGDRLAVRMNGHREVFHRPHDGRVSIEDVERARHLLSSTPEPKGSGSLLVVALDDESARILDFDLDDAAVRETGEKVTDTDSRARRLRTVARRSGRDDEADLVHYFDAVAAEIRATRPPSPFVLLGHGTGTSNAAEQFAERLRAAHHDVAERIASMGVIDLSAASDSDIEAAAQAAVGR